MLISLFCSAYYGCGWKVSDKRGYPRSDLRKKGSFQVTRIANKESRTVNREGSSYGPAIFFGGTIVL